VISGSPAIPIETAHAGRRAADFLALCKPRVVVMVLITTAVGYHLGGTSAPLDYVRLLSTLIGTALAAGGTLALNQYLERDRDALMERTRDRPLPDGRLAPLDALVFGAVVTAGGLIYLALAVDALPALVTAVTTVTYLFAYTPLKSRTSLCSIVGAVPGALPPLTGWAAACGTLGAGAWVIFAIMFLWQIPHSLAIACLYRDDYARAGMRLLPVIEPDGASTGRHVFSNSVALLLVALMPTMIGLAGPVYFFVALVLGLALVFASLQLARSSSQSDARLLLRATLIYLPLLLVAMAADKLPVSPW
jgi:protoheme IX farnesyltransferase